MSKSILYRLFGLGKKPQHLASLFESEGIILEDEGLKGSITFKDYRAPGKHFMWKRRWFPASIILTQTRLAAYAYSSPLVNIPLEDSRIKKLNLSIEENGKLCIRFSASDFHQDQSGEIECRFSTPLAQKFLEKLKPFIETL